MLERARFLMPFAPLRVNALEGNIDKSVHCQYNRKVMQKVFVNGNSLAVTVPKPLAEELDIKSGSQIAWEKTGKGLLLVTPKRAKAPTEIDSEVAKLIKKISKKYSGVWQDLAKI